MAPPVTFRPRGGAILAAIAIAICAIGLAYVAVTEGVVSLVTWAWPIVAVAWGAWLLYIRPSVRVTDGFVEVRNIVRTYRVPWGDVEDIDSRYALTIQTVDGRRIRAWAAPAPGARQAMTTRREEVTRTPGEGDTRRPSDARGTSSGDAAEVVRRAFETYQREGGTVLPGGTVTTWDIPVIVVTILLVAGAILTLVLPHG
ncbi:PH domain-containing protein [Microbacterium pumilum]|uniref:Low molecular weight protein antigen 6 PH domain-containing protein n=1 Tax=Microbacterium pumilum TaxID=344165 RepID=A0ABN2SU89_9MICO